MRQRAGNDWFGMLVDALVERRFPYRHAEIRPHRQWLVLAFYAAFLAAALWLVALPNAPAERRGAMVWFPATALTLSVVMSLAYFRYRVHFRTNGFYIYRWGRLAQFQPYTAFKELEMGYFTALRLLRTDGTSWNFPAVEDNETLAQVLWCLRRAGLSTPDAVAMQNRFGLESDASGSLGVFRKAARYR